MIRQDIGRVIVALFLGIAMWVPAFAEPTSVKVHVRAQDAKFIGSGVGGMNVVVEDARTGKLLASGQVSGATGDTNALMKEGQTRGQSPATPETAAFTAEMDINQPTLARFRVTGPLDVPQSIRELAVTQWVLPGQDQVDTGVVLQLPGLIVAPVEVAAEDGKVRASVHVTMMCGCPVTEGGLWDSADFTVKGTLYRDGEAVQGFPLAFTGEKNRFAGSAEAPGEGRYELWVTAYEKNADNTGAYHQAVSVQ